MSDISSEMIKETKKRIDELGLNQGKINYKVCDLEKLKGLFDVVVCLDVFIHYPQPVADIDVSKMAEQITEIKSMLTDQNQTNPENKINLPSFTPREASVLQLVAEGLMNKEIARKLETSIRNVEKYVSRLFIKTGTSSRTELVRYALENHLVK